MAPFCCQPTPSASSVPRLDRKVLGHVGLNRLYSLVTGNADAVVAVLDEVRVPDLVQPDRWQIKPTVERSIHPLPPLRKARLRGHEGAIEVPVAAHAANYFRDLDISQAQTTPVVRQVPLPDLVEGQQPAAFAPQTGRQASEEGPTPSAVEVRLGLYLDGGETNHRSPAPFLSSKQALVI